MEGELERLVEGLARAASNRMHPKKPSTAYVTGDFREWLTEPERVADGVAADPAYREAVAAVKADRELVQIADRRFAAASISRWVSAEDLVTAAIAAAAVEIRCLAMTPTPDLMASISLRNLKKQREVARAGSTEAVTVFGFSGLSLDQDQQVELPWGRLTARVGWYGAGELLRPTSCVLVSEHHRISVAVSETMEPQKRDRLFEQYNHWIQLTSRLLSLAVALATGPVRVAPIPTFELTLLPYETPMSVGGPAAVAPPGVDRRLTVNEAADVRRWAQVLGKRYSPKLDVAARRINAALSHRIDPADRLIDAVTAWESLFSSEQDATLRVTGSLAWLLEPTNPTARDERHAEAAKIYGLRSAVVHGRDPNPEEVHSASLRATELAVLAVANLLNVRPDLIRLDSKDRSRRLLLGLPEAAKASEPSEERP
jgi:hypothetical protein